MVPELEKARVTELQVRMDCNGCVQRIKRAVQGIHGVYSVYIDLAQQKLTVVGTADPEKIVRAIKKTRKTATVCSHTEQPVEPEPAPPAPENPPTEPAPPAPENPATEPAPPTEAPKDPPPPENQPDEIKPSPEATVQAPAEPEPKDAPEMNTVHHYPHSYRNMDTYFGHGVRPLQHEAPYYMTHSYNNYQPPRSLTEYGYHRSPPRVVHHSGAEAYHEGYYQNSGGRDEGHISSMFSDENPNACRIV